MATKYETVAGSQVERPARPHAWAVMCNGVAQNVCLTKVAAELLVENLLEQNRGRGFDIWAMPLFGRADIEIRSTETAACGGPQSEKPIDRGG